MYRKSTLNNPMMNVPITAYDNTQKYEDYYRIDNVGPYKEQQIKKEIDNNLNTIFLDPADYFYGKNVNRQWYSMPSGSVPNRQDVFAESLYGRDAVCKAGSIWMNYGIKYTKDSLACAGINQNGTLRNYSRE